MIWSYLRQHTTDSPNIHDDLHRNSIHTTSTSLYLSWNQHVHVNSNDDLHRKIAIVPISKNMVFQNANQVAKRWISNDDLIESTHQEYHQYGTVALSESDDLIDDLIESTYTMICKIPTTKSLESWYIQPPNWPRYGTYNHQIPLGLSRYTPIQWWFDRWLVDPTTKLALVSMEKVRKWAAF